MGQTIIVGCYYPNISSKRVSERGIIKDIENISALALMKGVEGLRILTDVNYPGAIYPTRRSLDSTLDSGCDFFYFTGHSEHGSILLSDGSSYPIREVLSRGTRGISSFTGIFDCCYFPSALLPYCSDGGHITGNFEEYSCAVYCIASSLEYQKSVGNKNGSAFTNMLYALGRDTDDTITLLEDINSALPMQNAVAYSNLPWQCRLNGKRHGERV